MNFQDISNLIFGGDIETFGGVSADELTDTFSVQEIGDARNFIDEYDAKLRRWGGIPFPGDLSEYDAVHHPGKAVLEHMIERWD